MSVPVIAIARDEAERATCYAIRTTVFVEEQGVPLDEELDEHEAQATHLLATIDGHPVGTLRWRVVPPGTAKIERVAVLREARGSGLGRMLIEAALQQAAAAGFGRAVLNAQAVAVDFYRRLGFVIAGEPFDEAGIPHVPMQLDDVLPKTN